MSDQILLRNMEFEGFHGVGDEERSLPQVIELDVELSLDLSAAGTSDDLARTVNYSEVFKVCREHVEERSYHLLEALGEALAADLLKRYPEIDSIFIEVRKPGVPIDGVLDYAGVRVERWQKTADKK